ncbi:hypothetical protein LCGC14_1076730 [marine sediment metagenome]|uniref:Uncharacterized protein n=1 Tax=marine sediment metagenome TaxID=412755 RepID=A0A0F9PZM8_9ZZZZ
MPGDDNNFPFGNSPENGREPNPEAETLRKQIEEIQKKLTGENSEPVTNIEILQFLRVINYNFLSLTRLLQAILLKSAEMDTALMNLELSTVRIGKRLQQFFETNSMLDEIEQGGDFNVSGSSPHSNFIF